MNSVSAIMTVRDSARTVAEALVAVLAADPFEVIVVDDGSTDGTADRVLEVNDPRIRLERTAQLGRSSSFNTAVALASGDFVAVCDGDDVTHPDRFASQLAAAAATGADVVGAWMNAVAGNRRWTMAYPTKDWVIRGELEQGRMPIAHAAALLRREWFSRQGGLDPSYPRAEDFELYYRARDRTVFAAVPRPLVEYRFRVLAHHAWSVDDALHRRVLGLAPRSENFSRIAYGRYRAVVAAQSIGLRIGRRGGGPAG